ncbi:MAG: TonB-dependent siderophore receptor [Pseudomonadota bacterium]
MVRIQAAVVLAIMIAGVLPIKNALAESPRPGDQTIEELVIVGELSKFGATKSEAPISEIPRSVSVITADEFLDRGALTLSNTLEYTAGVVGNAFGFATRGDFTSIRGLDAPEYQDNLQVLFGFYNNARADIYTLEQVEVLKGPASVLYGQAAPGGIVSTVSKIAGADQLGHEVVFTAGEHDRYQVSFDAGFDLSGDGTITARLVGVYRDSDTQVDFVEDDAIIFAPSLTYATDRSSLTLLLNYTDRESDTSAQFLPLAATACGSSDVTISEPNVCAGSPGQEVDPGVYVGDPGHNRYDTEATTVTLIGTHQINDYLSLEGTARYRDNEAEYDQSWVSFLGDGNPRLLPDGTAVGRTWYSAPAGSEQTAVDLRLRASFNTGSLNHDVLVGANYQDVETNIESALIYAAPTTFNIFNPVFDGSEIPAAAEFDAVRGAAETETVATDFYISDTIYFGNLIVNAGVRFSSVDSEDAASDQNDEETPVTFGALYKTRMGLNPYVSYAESFRATVGTDVVTGGALKPRKGEQTEIGVKYQPEGSSSFVTVAYFDLEEDNLVDFVTGGQTQPGLSIETDGFEVEALVAWQDFEIDFNYRHLDADEVDENGVAVPRPSLPENAASLWVSWKPLEGPARGWRVGAGARYASENESNGTAFLAANGFAPTPVRVETDGYTVFDAMVGYQYDNFDFVLNVRNLTDEEFYATCLSRGDCFPGEQRTVVGSLRMSF